MKFTISNQRAVTGNDIDLLVEAGGKEAITHVTCTLDGFEIGSEGLEETPVVSFHRTFSHVGDARPGLTHKFLAEVSVKDSDAVLRATRIWEDAT